MADQPDETVKIDPAVQTALAKRLTEQFGRWSSDRGGVEKQWLKNQRQYNGEYDPEVVSRLDENQSRAYPRLTRVKVVSMVARLMSLLFPAGESNWEIVPSPKPTLSEDALLHALTLWVQENPEAAFDLAEFDRITASFAQRAANDVNKVVSDQLGDLGAYGPADYQSLVRQVVYSAVKYGIGVLKGPSTMEDTRAVGSIIDGKPVVNTVQSYRPFYEYVDAFNYYPELGAKNFAQMDGQYERHILSKHQLLQLAKRADFKGDAIRDYLNTHADGNHVKKTFENEQSAGNRQQSATPVTNKYEVLEFWGYVSGRDLRASGADVPDDKLHIDIRSVMWILDDVVIKAAENPLPEGANMYHHFVFEEDDVNLLGNGLPSIIRDSQMGVANAARMLMDNASVVCGPNVEVDYYRLMAGQDTTLRPFKVWATDSNQQGTGNVVRSISFDAHIDSLLSVIRTFNDFADKESFVSPMTGGDMENAPSEPLRTSSSMSMVLGNAALPFRDVVRNFDRFTVSVLHSLIEWNKIFNSRAIMMGDLRPVGRGATSLIAKEVRALALDQLATTLLEEERDHLDMRELAKQRMTARDLPHDSLMVSKEVAQQRIDQRTQQQAASFDQQTRLIEAQIKDTNADAVKSAAQAQKNLDSASAAHYSQVLKAIEKGVNPDVVTAAAQRANTAPVVPGSGTDGSGNSGVVTNGLPAQSGEAVYSA